MECSTGNSLHSYRCSPHSAWMGLGWRSCLRAYLLPHTGHRSQPQLVQTDIGMDFKNRLPSFYRPSGSVQRDYHYDWHYTGGDLHECNGHSAAVSENGTSFYHYHITAEYPYISRCWKYAPQYGAAAQASLEKEARDAGFAPTPTPRLTPTPRIPPIPVALINLVPRPIL